MNDDNGTSLTVYAGNGGVAGTKMSPPLPSKSPHIDNDVLAYNWQARSIQDRETKISEVREIIAGLPTVFPKPMAFSYRNFKQYYSRHKFPDGERVSAGYQLLSGMLRWYFPSSKYEVYGRGLNERQDAFLETLPEQGTAYFLVRSKEMPLNDGVTKPAPSLFGTRPEIIPDACEEFEPPVTLLVVIATNPDWLRQHERLGRTNLKFCPLTASPSGFFELHDWPFSRGHVVILGGIADPKTKDPKSKKWIEPGGRPHWEFYSFDVGNNGNRSLVPWLGQHPKPAGYGANVFSFDTEESEMVHRMFQAIEINISGS